METTSEIKYCVIRKKDKMNFKGFYFDTKKFQFWGWTEPFIEGQRFFFRLILHEYPVSHFCIINDEVVMP